VTTDPALSGVQAIVTADMTDGRTLTLRCDHPRGSAENPLTRAQIEAKFRTYATARLPKLRVEQIIDAISQLETLPSATTLMELLRTSTGNKDAQRLRKTAAA
jgi:2-methylcitrate dehydratase PrpD